MNSMTTMFESSQRLSLSAGEEALLAGRPMVGVEDLFLGLFSAGGESSRLLAAEGVGLPAARAAVAAVNADRIAAPGIRPDEPKPQRVPSAGKVDFSKMAQSVLLNVTAYDDDRHVLLAAADSADGIVEEVLDRLGIDVAALREQIAEETSTPATATAAYPAVIHDESGTWLRITMPWHVAAVPEEVKALVADPGQWQRWNAHDGELDIDADGMVTLTDPRRSRWLSLLGVRTRRSRHRLVATDDPTSVAWEASTETVAAQPDRRRPSRQRLRIHLRAATVGTDVTFQSDWLLAGGAGRVPHRLLGYMLTSRVTVQASAITQALSQRPDVSG